MNYNKLISYSVLFFSSIIVSCNSGEQLTHYEGYELVWNDEFNEDGPVDSSSWSFEHGLVRNKELQSYQENNTYCRDGLLIIEGRKEKVENSRYVKGGKKWYNKNKYADYTSSSIKTKGKREFLYGRFEICARIPIASGAWPAIWTLGTSQRWPFCGEIDLLEYYQVKKVPTILANAAWGNEQNGAVWNSSRIPFSEFTKDDSDWADKFHVWRMDWDKDYIRLYLDKKLLNEIPLSQTFNGKPGGNINPFRQSHYILLNLAMGANGGKIDESKLPMVYEIDYVRVYKKLKK